MPRNELPQVSVEITRGCSHRASFVVAPAQRLRNRLFRQRRRHRNLTLWSRGRSFRSLYPSLVDQISGLPRPVAPWKLSSWGCSQVSRNAVCEGRIRDTRHRGRLMCKNPYSSATSGTKGRRYGFKRSILSVMEGLGSVIGG